MRKAFVKVPTLFFLRCPIIPELITVRLYDITLSSIRGSI